MELTKREYSMHGHNTMLKDFITHNEGKLKKLQDDAKVAQVTPALTTLLCFVIMLVFISVGFFFPTMSCEDDRACK